jgi:hypothetical protein
MSSRLNGAAGKVDLPIPLAEQVDIRDVAHSLSNQCRCNGWTSEFFSVAQHSLEVSALCAQYASSYNLNSTEAALAGLVHDAAEYVTGDCISPLKRHLGSAWKTMELEVEHLVFAGLDLTDLVTKCADLVAWADLEMLASDMARWDCFGDIVNSAGVEFKILTHNVVPAPFKLRFGTHKAMPPVLARHTYYTAYHKLHAKWQAEKPRIIPA